GVGGGRADAGRAVAGGAVGGRRRGPRRACGGDLVVYLAAAGGIAGRGAVSRGGGLVGAAADMVGRVVVGVGGGLARAAGLGGAAAAGGAPAGAPCRRCRGRPSRRPLGGGAVGCGG